MAKRTAVSLARMHESYKEEKKVKENMSDNTLSTLNNHLFAQIEKLGDAELKGDNLKQEIGRAKAISSVAKDIISNASLAVEASQIMQSGKGKQLPAMIGNG